MIRRTNRLVACARPCIQPLSRGSARATPSLARLQLQRNQLQYLAVPSWIRTLHFSSSRLDEHNTAATEAEAPTGDVANTFASLEERAAIHPVISQNIASMGITEMTDVQRLTIHEALKGVDVLAQAKTGTGKTLAFLLPTVQRILESSPQLAEDGGRKNHALSPIRAIIISPTRELAEQISKEAEKLVRNTAIIVQRAVGGTAKAQHLRSIQRRGCHLLVATPGRLKDILSDPAADISTDHVEFLVLDEADRLLDQGFRDEIQQIQKLYLPSRSEVDRQTLMFSATIPSEVASFARGILKKNQHFVQTVKKDEVPTHDKIPQFVVPVLAFENVLPSLIELCGRERAAARELGQPFKAIVYFPGSADVQLVSELLNSMKKNKSVNTFEGIQVLPIHGQMSQNKRTENAGGFRAAKSGILISTDVTARGLDFPGVTHVIQVGMPNDLETYIHRLGRTGRAGADGKGYLLIHSYLLNAGRKLLGSMPMSRDSSIGASRVSYTKGSNGQMEPVGASPEIMQMCRAVQAQAGKVDFGLKIDAYKVALNQVRWWQDKAAFIQHLNNYALVEWGMQRPIAIDRKRAQAYGLTNVPGVTIQSPSEQGSFSQRSEGRFGGRSNRILDRSKDSERSRGFERPRDSRSGRSGFGERRGFESDRRRSRYD